MRVPLLDLRPQLQALESELKAAVDDVLMSTRYIMGPRVEELETALAGYCGTRYAVGCTSGTDALLMCLMALDVGPEDYVLCPTYSFFATAGVIARLHATPVFLDIDPVSYNIAPAAVRDWLDRNPDKHDRVKALIPVHLYGQCADMDGLADICAPLNIPIIEDAAQAIGATYPGRDGVRRAGSLGLAGCFSFFPSKNLGAIGDGGMITTNDEQFAEKLRKLRNHGETSRYHHKYVGGNFRLDPMQAAVLLVKLPHLDSWHDGRRKNAAYYDQHLSQIAGLKTPTPVYGREHHIYNQYIISVPQDRDGLKRHLDEHEIGNAIYYPVPFHEQECFAGLGYRLGDLPHSEHAARHTLALPVFQDLTREMQDAVIAQVQAFYGG